MSKVAALRIPMYGGTWRDVVVPGPYTGVEAVRAAHPEWFARAERSTFVAPRSLTVVSDLLFGCAFVVRVTKDTTAPYGDPGSPYGRHAPAVYEVCIATADGIYYAVRDMRSDIDAVRALYALRVATILPLTPKDPT